MALKTILCILLYACRTRVYYPTMVSRFKLLSGTVFLPRFVAELVIHIEKNPRLVGFRQMHCCTDRSGIVHHSL